MFRRLRTAHGRIRFQSASCLAFCLALMATTAQAQECPVPFEFAGGTNLSQFGGSVASAGDVNGDGFEDIIVGASEDDAGHLEKPGRAFVFFGGPNADSVPDMTLTGDKDTQWFGRSVDGIGDYNDDGFDDVIVGAPGGLYAHPHDYPGDVYIYFGGLNPDSTADVHLSGENNDDGFGERVAGIRDFNADGFPDVLIGATRFDNFTGKAYVYYGGPDADQIADHTFTGSEAQDHLGSELSAAGDMNGDGFADCAVGAQQAAADKRGRAFVFFGGPTANFQPAMVLTGTVDHRYFGRKLRGVGDINDDGFDDLAVGSFDERVDIFFGAQFLPDNTSDLDFQGPGGQGVGATLGTADVNDDGSPDLLVGVPSHLVGARQGGRIYVYHGGPSLDNVADLILDGDPEGGGLGYAIASDIDFDGDGRQDIVAGAPAHPSSLPVGQVYVIPGTLFEDCDGNQIPDQCEFADGTAIDCNDNGILDSCDIASGTSNDCNLNGIPDECEVDCNGNGTPDNCDISSGSSPDCNLNGIPDECEVDCNGNGIPDSCDLASGFSEDCDGTGIPDECEAAALGMDCNANGVPDYCDVAAILAATGQGNQSGFGLDLATGGDFDGDGHEDLVVGAASALLHNGPGTAYLFSGGPGFDANAEMAFGGEGFGDEFGASLDFIGDFNGDGHDDLVIGAPENDSGPTDGGRAYVFFGGPGADPNADLILINPGGGFGNKLGQVVAGAGDVNGDGFDDVLAGAPGASQSSRLFLYLGSGQYSQGSQLQPSQMYGNAGLSWTYPASLDGGGDVNGDQYDDVIVGAYAAGGGSSQVEVLLGGPGGLTLSAVIFGQNSGDLFGFSVAFTGDQNGDGTDDIIVGAPFDSSVGFQTGRAYLYFGGNGMDTDFDIVFGPPPVPLLNDGRFGSSVAGGRDLNADGFDDIMIGQSALANGGKAGRAYVFFGKVGDDLELDRLIVGAVPGDETGRDVELAGDLNGDGLADFVVGAPSSDFMGRIDVFDVRATTFLDCNENGIGDACDIESGVASDVNDNSIPDICEATAVRPGAPELQLRLRGATPNPFNPATVLAFDVPVAGRAQIEVFDVKGRRVRLLLAGAMEEGSHDVLWRGDNDAGGQVASGVYFARLSLVANGGQFAPSVMKLMLLK